jgi:hypothetical protein
MSDYTVRALAPDTWDPFAALAERHNGVWNGCWCTWFHPADIGDDSNRARKQRLVAEGLAAVAQRGALNLIAAAGGPKVRTTA